MSCLATKHLDVKSVTCPSWAKPKKGNTPKHGVEIQLYKDFPLQKYENARCVPSAMSLRDSKMPGMDSATWKLEHLHFTKGLNFREAILLSDVCYQESVTIRRVKGPDLGHWKTGTALESSGAAPHLLFGPLTWQHLPFASSHQLTLMSHLAKKK